jgi:hypothetical protein
MLFVNSLTIISITAAELCIATDCTLTKSEIIYVYKPSEGFEMLYDNHACSCKTHHQISSRRRVNKTRGLNTSIRPEIR